MRSPLVKQIKTGYITLNPKTFGNLLSFKYPAPAKPTASTFKNPRFSSLELCVKDEADFDERP
jgi:hypothetical protein